MAGTRGNNAPGSFSVSASGMYPSVPVPVDVGSAETIFQEFANAYSTHVPHIGVLDLETFKQFVNTMEQAMALPDDDGDNLNAQEARGLRDHLILWYEPYCNKDPNAMTTTTPDYRNVSEGEAENYLKWVLDIMGEAGRPNDKYKATTPPPCPACENKLDAQGEPVVHLLDETKAKVIQKAMVNFDWRYGA
ncbi:hypothetical protein H2200_010467 [Cladophialophora chaetospira]|uniref:Uncharacterized protein n=1 Tax=Cladophialophora chaetospira TaxID=386627 RepID=A0AA39CEC4_9EURO|nr:hypothetical protein H2200_010467 [Cladophialophora chaetospira]